LVELNDIAKKFEYILNSNTLGKTFRIFSDSGELAKRNGRKNEYRNGLLEVVSRTTSNISGLEFISSSVNLTLYANEDARGKNSDGNSIEIIELRQILGDFLEYYNFKTFAEEFGGKTYSTTYVIGETTTLPKGSLGYINDCVPLITNIGLTFFENGVNSNEWIIEIDGEEVGYTNAVISRTKTAENMPLAESKSTKSVMQTNGFGIDLVVPQISSNLGNAIEDELLTGKEYAHMVYIKGKNTEQTYICVFGNLQASLIKNANVGFNVPLVEGVPELLDYKENVWASYEAESIGNTVCLFKNVDEDEVVIFWGDGEVSFSNQERNSHIYENEGLYIVKVFNKDAVNNNWYEFSINYYTITYNLDGGYFTGQAPSEYNPFEEEDTLIPNPVKNGYEFSGWIGDDLDEPTIDLVIEAGTFGNKEFTATWEIIDYTISYDLNGGSVSGTNPTTYNAETAEITLINPTRLGYEFTGWSGTGITGTSMNVVIPTGSFGDRNYTANWEIIEYTITYVLNGGTNNVNNPATYTIESGTIYLLNPTRLGYEFAGWYTTSDFQSETKTSGIYIGSTGNITLYAKFTGLQYTLTYDVNGGEQNPSAGPIVWPPNPKTVTYGSSIGTLYPLHYSIKTGYYAEGWYIDGNKISSSTIWNWDSNKTAVLNWVSI
jgi:uncharacterized repeat protein (TIGR02543 family)